MAKQGGEQRTPRPIRALGPQPLQGLLAGPPRVRCGVPEQELPTQFSARSLLTVVVRQLPLVPAPDGRQVARPTRTDDDSYLGTSFGPTVVGQDG